MNIVNETTKKNSGYVVITALVFSAIFMSLVAGLVGFMFVQSRAQNLKEADAQAYQVAEAGLEYYRWYLAHNPGDVTHGTSSPPPYEKEIVDPEGGAIGMAEIDVDGNEVCGQVMSIDISSTGYTYEYPDRRRTVSARHTRPSVAEYSYIIDSNVWAGADREINGPYHTNGGVRMDGENNSLVTSAQEEWECTSNFGCSGQQTQPGVFGDGPNSELWDYPVPQIDFEGMSINLSDIRDAATSDGIYLGPAGGQSNQHGWHLIFQGNGTVDVYRVQQTDYAKHVVGQECFFFGLICFDETENDHHIIDNENFVANYTIPESCPVIYAEDFVWVEGEVRGRVTLAADKPQPNHEVDVVLNDNIIYAGSEDGDGLTVIAERSVLIPLLSPNEMTLNGIFIANEGKFGRNNYTGETNVGSAGAYVVRDQLTINGTIVSKGRVGTKWSSGPITVSGYENRINSYDRKLADEPPAFTPYASLDYELIEWREDIAGEEE